MKKSHTLLLLLLILLAAFALRTWQLTEIPPGLTHDEANHGREALGILDGVLLFYFPLNYGSEPLYSYTAALSMWLFGEGAFALRLVNVIFGMAAIAAAYAWAARAFDRKTAVLSAALIALSFWPVASSREALRAGMLPFFTAAAVYFFWRILVTTHHSSFILHPSSFILFSVSLAFTLHIYLASRVAWLMFPLFLLYLALFHRPTFKQAWKPVLAGLLLAGLLVTPMFVYLKLHPEALTRLDMLDGPVQDILSGRWQPVFKNVSGALLAFFRPGYGDQFLAYNIPGRPVLNGVTAVFFITGLLVSLWRWRQPAYALLLLWFGAGVIPSLITGATANTTRNMAALPAVYILPAVGFWAAAVWLMDRFPRVKRPLVWGTAVLWLLIVGWTTWQTYFLDWSQRPDVRGAYQVNLVHALELAAGQNRESALTISTVYPGPVHDASIALVLQPDNSQNRRWTDARFALIWPGEQPTAVLIPASTPPNPVFRPWLTPIDSRTLRPDDLDPAVTLYQLTPPVLDTADSLANFDNAVRLLSAHWDASPVHPGETATLITFWQVTDPERIGPSHPPADAPDTVFFTQILNPDGTVLAQRDALDAPSWDWQSGDLIVQVHPIPIPAETAPGRYEVIVGVYDRPTGERLPVVNSQGQGIGTFAKAMRLFIEE